MRKQFCSLFLVWLLLLTLLPAPALGESGGEDTDIYLAFTSDVHNVGTVPNANSPKVLGEWIRGVSDALGGVSFASMGFCGDYGDYSAASAKVYWQQTQVVMDVVDAAGSMCSSKTYSGGGNVQARGLVAVIDAAGTVSFRYYGSDCKAFGETAFPSVRTGFLAGYEGGRMLGVLPVYGITAEEPRVDMTLLSCPWSAADTAKVFFLTEDCRPSALLRLK